MSPTLARAGARMLARHPWQTGLAVLGIALGVAVVVAIDLANVSARRAFTLSTEAVTGRTTHQVVGGPRGLPEALYRELRVDGRVRPSAPVVEGHATVVGRDGFTLRVLGVDPFAEAPFRPWLGGAGRVEGLAALLTRPGAVLASRETARSLGIDVDEALAVRVGGTRRTVLLVGLLEPADAVSRQALDGLLVADIAGAQELLGLPGALSRIDLIAPAGPAAAAWLERVAARLPPGAEIVRASARAETAEQMTRAFHVNLTALSLLALVVGMFLIHNTMTFSVVRRRTAIGLLRALGVTRREVFALVLAEALLIGLVATALGLLLGLALGQGLVRLVTRTINDLYFVVSVRELAVAPATLAKAVALGLGATVVAALAPAWEATTAPPRAVLSRSAIERRWRRTSLRAAVAGALVLPVAGALLLPGTSLALSHAGLFVLVIGCALLTPAATVLAVRGLRPVAARLGGVPGALAVGGVLGSLSRTGVAAAALMVAIATAVGVGIMVGSFRQTVDAWLTSSLSADVYVSAPSPVSRGPEATLDPALVERLAATPGVAGVSRQRSVVVRSPQGPTRLVALTLEPPAHRAFRFRAAAPDALGRAWEGGAALVSEPYAERHGLGVGDTLRLRTDRGERAFPVAGVFYDYASDQGVVMLSLATYERYWDDRGLSGLGLHAAPGTDVDALVAALRARAAPDHEVLIRSSRGLREVSLEVFDRTFAITAVLRALALLVAVIGVLSALMALQLERERELAVLRAQGLTPGQLWALVTTQTGLLGLVAGLLALPVGTALALVLVHVINRRSFGWTLEVHLGPAALLEALGLAVAAAILAGALPAARMARTPPAEALRSE